ncbi:MAG TPA: hypothetical protein VMZ26_09345 [Pyrinomonadaceae bacterium]|nr:hypothetical protein [Pyrinomonadaceae bacterium]
MSEQHASAASSNASSGAPALPPRQINIRQMKLTENVHIIMEMLPGKDNNERDEGRRLMLLEKPDPTKDGVCSPCSVVTLYTDGVRRLQESLEALQLCVEGGVYKFALLERNETAPRSSAASLGKLNFAVARVHPYDNAGQLALGHITLDLNGVVECWPSQLPLLYHSQTVCLPMRCLNRLKAFLKRVIPIAAAAAAEVVSAGDNTTSSIGKQRRKSDGSACDSTTTTAEPNEDERKKQRRLDNENVHEEATSNASRGGGNVTPTTDEPMAEDEEAEADFHSAKLVSLLWDKLTKSDSSGETTTTTDNHGNGETGERAHQSHSLVREVTIIFFADINTIII